MPRPERPLDPHAGPVQSFAAELRMVRDKAGSPKYLQMARVTGRSRTALAEAAGGDHLPTWETVEAYLTACGENPASWRTRWESVRLELDQARTPGSSAPGADRQPPATAPPSDIRRPQPRRVIVGAMLVAFAVVALAVILVAAAMRAAGPRAARVSRPADASSGPVVIVQNKVAVGASSLYEDTTPSYLSTKTDPECANYGCEIRGTQMWSGQVLRALCQQQGAVMTNANLSSAGIGRNPGKVTSSLWYRAEMPDGAVGYISEVYLTPSSRGGLELPRCSTR